MTKLIKKKSTILLSIAILLLGISSLMLLLTTNDKGQANKDIGNKSIKETIEIVPLSVSQLSVPTFSKQNGNLVWQAPSEADNVEVYINGELVEANAPCFYERNPNKIKMSPGANTIKIRAVSNDSNYAPSEFTEEISLYKLEKPILVEDGNYLKWESITGAVSYYFYSQLILPTPRTPETSTITETRISMNYFIRGNEGGYKFSVTANAQNSSESVLFVNSDESYFEKDGSSTITISKKETPVLYYDNFNLLYWDDLGDVSNYFIRVNNVTNWVVTIPATDLKIDLQTIFTKNGVYSFTDNGEYSFYLFANFDSFLYISSDNSNTVSVYINKMPTFQLEFDTETRILSWYSDFPYVDEFIIRIRNSTGDVIKTIITSDYSLYFDSDLLYELGSGTFKVTVQGLGKKSSKQ